MAILDILQHPDERLHVRAEPVTRFDARLRRLADDMTETLYASQGIGLAATQVGVCERVVVVDISREARRGAQVFVNPEIVTREGETVYEEGCLSVPGIRDKVTRSACLTLRAQDVEGRPVEIEAEGLLAICLQHELDHLDGILFIQRLPEPQCATDVPGAR